MDRRVFIFAIMIIVLLNLCLFGYTGKLIKPNTNYPIYLVALTNVGAIKDLGAIQVEFAKIGFKVLRTEKPLELTYKSAQLYNATFIIQFYENGDIAFFSLLRQWEPGGMVRELFEFFFEGKIKEEFYSSLINSGEFSFEQIKNLKILSNWIFYAMDLDLWTLGRVYVESGTKPGLSIMTQENPDYAWFSFNWNFEINGVYVRGSDRENYARHFKKGKNFISLPLDRQATSRYFYFLIDGGAGILPEVKRFDTIQFKSNYLGDLWK